MSRPRKHVSFKTKLVAALCQMRHEVDGKLELILNHDEAKALSEDQILSLFHWEHGVIPHAEDGPDCHWNLEPMLIAPHREKTATVDVPGIAKRKRVAKGHIEHTRTMMTPRDQRQPKQSRWGSRPFPKRQKGATK
jgi:hypothetical protein